MREEYPYILDDENDEPQWYNEVVGICYGKAILVTADGEVRWIEAHQPHTMPIGVSLHDHGNFKFLSELDSKEQRAILSYLIESGATPKEYVNLLKWHLQEVSDHETNEQ